MDLSILSSLTLLVPAGMMHRAPTLLFYLFFGLQVIVYNTTLKFQNLQFRNPIKNFTIKNLTMNIRLHYNLNKMINGVNVIIIANYYINFLKEAKHV